MHLAHANAAVMLSSYEDPSMADFVAQLDPVNAAADSSPGFVWRLDDSNVEFDIDEEAAKIFGVDSLLFNMSVWESIDALEEFTYKSNHHDVVRERAKWFQKPTRSPFVLWWIEEGHLPSIEEAKQRFDMLWDGGPSADAFTFAARFRP